MIFFLEAKLLISVKTESVLIVTAITIIEVIKMVQVNVDIEEATHKAIRKEAIDRGIAMKELLREMIEEAGRGLLEREFPEDIEVMEKAGEL